MLVFDDEVETGMECVVAKKKGIVTSFWFNRRSNLNTVHSFIPFPACSSLLIGDDLKRGEMEWCDWLLALPLE